jgi:hypothetical protein
MLSSPRVFELVTGADAASMESSPSTFVIATVPTARYRATCFPPGNGHPKIGVGVESTPAAGDGHPAATFAPLFPVMVIREGPIVPHPELGGRPGRQPGILDLVGRVDQAQRLPAVDFTLRHLDPGRVGSTPGNLGYHSGTGACFDPELAGQIVDGDVAAGDGVALDLLGAGGRKRKEAAEQGENGPAEPKRYDGLHENVLLEETRG